MNKDTYIWNLVRNNTDVTCKLNSEGNLGFNVACSKPLVNYMVEHPEDHEIIANEIIKLTDSYLPCYMKGM